MPKPFHSTRRATLAVLIAAADEMLRALLARAQSPDDDLLQSIRELLASR